MPHNEESGEARKFEEQGRKSEVKEQENEPYEDAAEEEQESAKGLDSSKNADQESMLEEMKEVQQSRTKYDRILEAQAKEQAILEQKRASTALTVAPKLSTMAKFPIMAKLPTIARMPPEESKISLLGVGGTSFKRKTPPQDSSTMSLKPAAKPTTHEKKYYY